MYVPYYVAARTYISHRMEARPSARSTARGGLGWGQGREMLLFWGWKRHAGLFPIPIPGDAWEPRVGPTRPRLPPWFCLEVWLNPRGICFSLCMLAFSWFLWFLSQVLHVCASHQRPQGSPQLSFTLPAKVSQQRGTPTMPLLTLAVRHLPPLLLHPRQSGNSLIA